MVPQTLVVVVEVVEVVVVIIQDILVVITLYTLVASTQLALDPEILLRSEVP